MLSTSDYRSLARANNRQTMLAYGAAALALGAGLLIGLVIAPVPAPLYAFNVSTGTEWHTMDYDLSQSDCFTLLAASPADVTAACDRQH